MSTKFDLVCDNEHLRSLLGTVLILGLLFGSIIGGALGDKFGRKKAIFGAIAFTIPVLFGSGFVNDYNGRQFKKISVLHCCSIENQQSPFYVVNRVTLTEKN